MAKERTEEIRKLVEQNPGLTAQQITQKFPQTFKNQNDQSEIALLEQFIIEEQQARKASLEEDDLIASAKMPATRTTVQVKKIIQDELGGKPLKDNEYKFGLTGYVKMSTSFDTAGNLSGVKGNNYQAMAKTLAKSGTNNISVEGSPYRAYRMFRAAVENGLSVTNITINRSLPITARSWSYDSRKSPLDNREALQKAFSFIPAGELDKLIDKLEKNRETIALKAAAGKSANDEKSEVTEPTLAAAGVEAALLAENPNIANNEMVITSNAEFENTSRLQEILGSAPGFTAEVVQETGRFISQGSKDSQISQLDAHIRAGATQLYVDGKRVDPDNMSVTMRQARSENFESPIAQFRDDSIATFLDKINTQRQSLGIPSQLMTTNDIEREMKSPNSLVSSTMNEISTMIAVVELRGQILHQIHELELMIKESLAGRESKDDQSEMSVNADISPDEKEALERLAEDLKKQEQALTNLLNEKAGLLIEIEGLKKQIQAQNTQATKHVAGALSQNLSVVLKPEHESSLQSILSSPVSAVNAAQQMITQQIVPVLEQILRDNPDSYHAINRPQPGSADYVDYMTKLVETSGIKNIVESHIASRRELEGRLEQVHARAAEVDRSIHSLKETIDRPGSALSNSVEKTEKEDDISIASRKT